MQQRSEMCRPYRRQLPAWIDGELAAGEQRRMEAHVATCEQCRAEAAAWQSLGEDLRQAGPIPVAVPDGLLAGVLAAASPATVLPVSTQQPSRPSLWRAWLLGLMLCGMAATGTWLFWRGHPHLAVTFVCLALATAGLLTLVSLLGLWPDAPPLTPTEEA